MGLLFPAFKGAQDSAKKAQAKNDVSQIVTAVNAYYTEYGSYPIDTTVHPNTDVVYGDPGGNFDNAEVISILRNTSATLNPRRVVFLQVSDVRDPGNPRGGIATTAKSQNGWSIQVGSYVDPWGGEYLVAIDGTYDNNATLSPNYNDLPPTVATGCIAWSFGKDYQKGNASGNYTNSDDILSWK